MSFRPRAVAFLAALAASLAAVPAGSALAAATPSTTPVTSVNLADYGLVGRYVLPSSEHPLGGNTACTSDAGDVLADEASAVAYDPNGNGGVGSLFVLGDGGSCLVQTTLNGTYIDSMTLANGNSAQKNAFYDTEGVTYVGQDGTKPQLVMTEERYRNLDEFDYTPNTTLTLGDAQAVKLGTTIGNIGLEGVTYDPATSNGTNCSAQTVGSVTGNFCQGFIVVKEQEPEDIFQTNVDWGSRGAESTDQPTGTATNGGANENEGSGSAPTSLFPPADANLNDFADIFALSNLPSLDNTDSIAGNDDTNYDGDILIDSQASGSIEELDRSGNIKSRLDLFPNPASGLDVIDETHEGVTMDNDGNLYVVSEDGAGPSDPELDVYAPESAANDLSPTAVSLASSSGELPSNTTTANGPVELSSLSITDADGIGTDTYTVKATDADGKDVSDLFNADHTGLYVASGASLANVASPVTIKVSVSDPGSTDPSSVVSTGNFTLTVDSVGSASGAESKVIISEVDPSGSGGGNNGYGEDWFELTNTGTQPVDLTGWSADDSHEAAGKYPLNGVSAIAPGESVVFVQADTAAGAGLTPAQTVAAFRTDWSLGPNVQVGYYSDEDGLSQSGDEVNVYDGGENLVAGVSFGASENKVSFDNSAGINGAISTVSDAGGDGGAYTSSTGEVGSPGIAGIAPTVAVTEVDPAGSSAVYGSDWFELTNYGVNPVNISGWTMDDSSATQSDSVSMTTGTDSSTLAPGASIVFAEDPQDSTVSSGSESLTNLNGDWSTVETAFENAWFGSKVPSNFQFGVYGGSGVGLSTKGDGVTIFDASGNVVDEVQFGSATGIFENPGLVGEGASASEATAPSLTATAVNGEQGAFTSATSSEVGSPGVYVPTAEITEIDPAGSSASYGSDWFELTNNGPLAIDLANWTMDDSSDALATSVSTTMGTTAPSILPVGQSIVFAEDPADVNVTSGSEAVATLEADLPSVETAFDTAWFSGGIAPSNFLFGVYGGKGVGLSTSGDGVNLFDAAGNQVVGVTFGAAPANGATFDDSTGTSVASVASALGVDGARASQDGKEIGSPGTIAKDTKAPTITTPADAGTFAWTDTVDIACTAVDDTYGSGVQSCTGGIDEPASTLGAGAHTLTLTATDYAGNSATETVTFTVQPQSDQGGGNPPSGDNGGGNPPSGDNGGGNPPSNGGGNPPSNGSTPPPSTSGSTPPNSGSSTPPATVADGGSSTTKSAPAPKVGTLGSSTTEKKIEKGLNVTVTKAKAKSKVTLTVEIGKKKVATFDGTASKSGKATVKLHLTKQQAAKYSGKKLTLHFTVTDSKGHKHTVSKTLKLS